MNIRTRATETWTQLAVWQRFAGIAILLSTVGLIAVLSLWMREPSYSVLYRDLNERDAAAMVSVLEGSAIPYRLNATATAIEVPETYVAQARLDLAAQNLPQGGSIGYELFDGGALDSLGMTEFMQRMNFQRALEGELTRTISSIDGVDMARVHIVIPEESLFAAQQNPTKASVILKINPGARLDSTQIQSIRFLVASSVDSLEPGNISIMDVAGTLYDMPDANGEMSSALATNSQLEVQRLWELETQNDLQAMLDQTLGPGTSVVRVSVEMDWDQEESQVELYAPAGEVGSVIRSSNREEESYTGNGNAAAGVPGVDPNAPVDVPVFQAVDGAGDGEYTRRSDTINYEVSKETRNTVKQPGAVQRMSVAVMLDDALPAEQVAVVQDLIGAAVGLDAERGDLVRVQQIPFNDDFYAQEMALMQANQQRDFYIRIGIIVAVLLGLGLILFFTRKIFDDMQKRMMPYVVDESNPALAPPDDAESQKMLDGLKRQNAASKYAQAMDPNGGYDDEDLDNFEDFLQLPAPDESELRLRAIARHNPEVVASILEDWTGHEATPALR